MVMSFYAVLFPTRCLDEILNLIESVSEDFPSYSVICGVIIWAAFMNWNYFGLLQTFRKYSDGDANIDDFQYRRTYYFC